MGTGTQWLSAFAGLVVLSSNLPPKYKSSAGVLKAMSASMSVFTKKWLVIWDAIQQGLVDVTLEVLDVHPRQVRKRPLFCQPLSQRE